MSLGRDGANGRLSAKWRPSERLSVQATSHRVDEESKGAPEAHAADINDSEPDEGPDLISFTKGNSMRFAPEWTVAASVDYTIELPGTLEGRVRVDHQRVGEQFQDVANTILIDEYDITHARATLSSALLRRMVPAAGRPPTGIRPGRE
ncbi:MAG: hypothetical protein OXE40_03115 [Gammaproteobacteria bacterium]|nr:hypothetical protein [Gammaproteobacteria bacterium]